jgi:hypothetical protein
MIGTDVGNVGEREFQSQTTGRFSARTAAIIAPSARNSNWSSCPSGIFGSRWEARLRRIDINGVPGLEDQRRLLSLAGRFARSALPVSRSGNGALRALTFAAETHADRVDETTAAGPEFRHGVHAGVRPGIDAEPRRRGVQPDLQPEWTRFVGRAAEQESTIGAALG